MNTLPSSLPRSTNTMRPNYNNIALAVSALLLSSCAIPETRTHKEEIRKPLETKALPVTPLEEIMKQLEQELTADLTEKIQNNPEFHSLEKIQHYLDQEIQKRWITWMVSLQIAPFIPDGKGGLIYLMVSIITPQGAINMRLVTQERKAITPALMRMLDYFEQELQICVLTTCLEEIERTQGVLRVDLLEAKIHQSLEGMADEFRRHGLEYKWIKLINDNGDMKCMMEFIDILSGELKIAPLPTEIKVEEPVKKPRQWETMIA